MVWQIRRQDESDGTDEIQPVTHPTIASAYSAAMDDMQARLKAMLLADPTMLSAKMKFVRDNVGSKGFTMRLDNVQDKTLSYIVTEVP